MGVLTKLFNWVMVSSISAIVLISMILFIKLILKHRQNANWHYYIWFILIIKLIAPCLPESSVSIFNIFNKVSKISVSQYSEFEINKEEKAIVLKKNIKNLENNLYKTSIDRKDINISKVNNYKIIKSNFNIKEKIIIVWFLGIIFIGLYIIFINMRFHLKIKAECKNEVPESLIKTLDECRNTLKINKNLDLILTSEVSIPSIFGVIKPKLLIPNSILEKITNEQLKHVFLHELSHYKRRDNFINWITILLKTLHWFNPFIWYSFYKMHGDCEIACDASVVSYMNDEERISYGYTLLHLIKITSKVSNIPGALSIFSNKSEIKRRIIMISLFRKKTFKSSSTGLLIIIAVGVFLLTNSKDYTKKIKNEVKAETISGKTNVDINNLISVNDIDGKILEHSKFKGKLMIISDPKKITVGYSLKNSKPNKNVLEIAEAEKAVAAINAGSFKEDLSPLGFILKDGNLVYTDSSDKNNKQNIVGFTDLGLMVIGNYNLSELKKLKVKNAITNKWPLLIINGKATKEAHGKFGINPRTAIAQKSDGSVLMLVIDGRNFESMGAEIGDITDILLKNGAINAVMLDGGSSTTMYFKGEIINNSCSDEPKGRLVPATFSVLS